MSTRHFFSDSTGVVVRALIALTARNPHMQLDETNRVVYSKTHSPSKVSVISGGGSGHEPAWSGYVGDGMLAAAVCGEIFASPSTKQIMSAIKNVPSENGIILCITNYTGDMLHFGLAREKALALGYKVSVISMSEDAALGRKKAEYVGRRGLAGNLLVIKLVGTASQESWPFERVLELGRQCNDQLVTMGTSLDHCHVLGRTHHETVPENSCVLGMGIHNEPGLQTLTPIPTADEVIKRMLLFLLDPNDEDRAFVKFSPGDEVALLVNNFGGMSVLELDAMTSIALSQLESDWNIKPVRIYSGVMEASLNAPGFSLTLGNLSGIARSIDVSVEEILHLLDLPTSAPAWPKSAYSGPKSSNESERLREGAYKTSEEGLTNDNRLKINPASANKALAKACNRAIAAEPDITKFDMQMGDGDCGEAVKSVCDAILKKLSGVLSSETDLNSYLEQIGDSVEDVGGSLGAILAIFLAAFSNNLRQAQELNVEAVAKAAPAALENLKLYTSARSGDRTVMDTLIPFCEKLQNTNDLEKAVEAAEKGAENTRGMQARFGRATYVGDKVEGLSEMPPDPGAWAAAIFLRGYLRGLQK
ncbi:dihydroxyacetone kinase [Patellaria atrata CBS 101060]|uniref:Dihydroxyacetone kinase n=1 Tax=Patellaria atrata CBS 101060 TaxID=1346257 RepID=A0A9P4VLR6_9PEZI|nr:dihydroxyacetone kinase [Patellaria atrata CBS 101060]